MKKQNFIFLSIVLILSATFFSCQNDTWHVVGEGENPKFMNGWHSLDTGRTTRYMKVGDVVYMQGVVTGGGKGSAAFTLPEGYRPSRFIEAPAGSQGEMYSTAAIGDDGKVSLWYHDGGEKVILNISFITK